MGYNNAINVTDDVKDRFDQLQRQIEARIGEDMPKDAVLDALLVTRSHDNVLAEVTQLDIDRETWIGTVEGDGDTEYVPLEEVADDDADRSSEGPPPEDAETQDLRWSGESYTEDE